MFLVVRFGVLASCGTWAFVRRKASRFYLRALSFQRVSPQPSLLLNSQMFCKLQEYLTLFFFQEFETEWFYEGCRVQI